MTGAYALADVAAPVLTNVTATQSGGAIRVSLSTNERCTVRCIVVASNATAPSLNAVAASDSDDVATQVATSSGPVFVLVPTSVSGMKTAFCTAIDVVGNIAPLVNGSAVDFGALWTRGVPMYAS